MSRLATAAAMTALIAGCDQLENAVATATDAARGALGREEAPAKPAVAPEIGDFGVDLAQRDENVDPGDDFFLYANGTWVDTFEMPADLTRYTSFTHLSLEAEEDIRRIVEDLAASDPAPGSLEQKIGDFYAAWMDVEALDEMGAAPLKPHLDRIYGIQGPDDLAEFYARGNLHSDAPFAVGVIPDPADTTRYIAFVSQSGLGMPNRDYYLKEDERFVQYRNAYDTYATVLFELAGLDDPDGRADRVIALETELARLQWSPADSRDIQKIYNPMSPDELAATAPDFDWSTILGALQLDGVDTFVVAQPSAIEGAGKLLAETPLDTIKDYLAFHFINAHATHLSTSFDDASFAFFDKTLRGAQEKRDRWKRGVVMINDGLGEAVGQIYVERHFPPENKAQMEKLVANLTAALEERLKANDWMDDATREQALLKLSTFEPKIGYTEKWTDFGRLNIAKGDLLGASLSIADFEWAEDINRLAGPVDRKIWPYPPQTVNASYNALLNQITFPAGILQPPFFDPYADAAVNYGAIGAVIGHEIGHGFDDQGRRFDESGRIRDWWTEEANARFQARADALGAQYASYEPVEGLNIDPRLTMGENIGDLGGLQMAYAAYHRYLDECCGGEAPVINGLTGDQRFFLGWAQVWRAKAREDELRRRLVTDPHSPPEYRVNGVVRNLDAWYEAFDVTEDDALYLPPDERVRIW
ncbi:MAG: M13 family peptidase [Alphaproteobacteria bacterium]|nr:M13 family peptidase [Alphaproteobacteria bacterium]